MSTAAKLTLATSIVFTTGIIVWVHRNQQSTHELMIKSVVDEEVQRRLDTNRRELEEQRQLEAHLRAMEKERLATDASAKP